MWPAIVTTDLLAFIAAWNDFLFALTFTLSNEQRTVPVAIALITGASQHELPWGNIMAASVIVTLPLVALVLVFQRKIVAGFPPPPAHGGKTKGEVGPHDSPHKFRDGGTVPAVQPPPPHKKCVALL